MLTLFLSIFPFFCCDYFHSFQIAKIATRSPPNFALLYTKKVHLDGINHLLNQLKQGKRLW